MLVSGRGNVAVTVTFLKSKFSCSLASAVRCLFIKPEGNRRESPAVILTLLKLQGNGTSLQTEASGDVRTLGWGCPALSGMKSLVTAHTETPQLQKRTCWVSWSAWHKISMHVHTPEKDVLNSDFQLLLSTIWLTVQADKMRASATFCCLPFLSKAAVVSYVILLFISAS